MTGRPITYPAQQVINAVVATAIVGLAVATLVTGNTTLLVVLSVLSLGLGSSSCCPSAGPTCRC
jgi:hypothetical protein